MNREELDKWCERGILVLVLAIMIFGPLSIGAVRTQDFLVIQALTLGVAGLWGLRMWLTERPQLLWPPISWAVVAFTLYAAARYLAADIEYVARIEFVNILVYALLFFAIINNLHRQESTQIIVYTMIGLATLISFYAVYQFMTDSTKVWHFTKPEMYKHRGSGTYICPNHLAGFLELLLPLGFAYALTSRLKPLGKIFLGYASLVMLAGIAVTVSRGSWVAVALALMIFFGLLMRNPAHRVPALAMLALLILGSTVIIYRTEHFQARFKRMVQGGRLDDDKRFSLWKPAFRIWQENLWWGVGPGHFDYRFAQFRPEDVQMRPERAHNDILNTFVDYGAAGAVLVSAAWVLLALGVGKTWGFVRGSASDLGGRKNSTKFAFVIGASAGLLALLIHSIIDFNFHIPANAILAVALMALLSAHLRFATERYWVGMGLWLKLAAALVLLGGMFYLGQQGWRRYSEYVWLAKAARVARVTAHSAAEASMLEKAFEVEPRNFETAFEIGEANRFHSREGGPDFRQSAEKAMEWYARAMKLNPYHAYSPLYYGACLDWVGKQSESLPYFSRAEALDPNGYYTVANIGLHYVETRDYAAARPWLIRSRTLGGATNTIAITYLTIVEGKLAEAATNEFTAKLDSFTQ